MQARQLPCCVLHAEGVGAEACTWAHAGDLQTKGVENELETYQVQTRVLNESVALKKVPTLCPASLQSVDLRACCRWVPDHCAAVSITACKNCA